MRKVLAILVILHVFLLAAESKSMTREELLEEKFGRLPVHDDLITGIRFDDLLGKFLDSNYSQSNKMLKPSGVIYLYKVSGNKYPPFHASVGVYENQNIANYQFIQGYLWSSLPPAPCLGIGDRAFIGTSGVIILINNVLLQLHVAGKDEQKLIDNLLDSSLIKELESSSAFVSRGKSVNMPVIEKVDLPDRVQHGQRITGKVSIKNIDVSKAIFGTESKVPFLSCDARINTKGDDIEVVYHPLSHEVGPQEFTIYVATPENVIAMKDIKIIVE